MTYYTKLCYILPYILYCNVLKEAYGLKSGEMTQLCDHDGTTVLQEKEKILERFSDRFKQFLNIPGSWMKQQATRHCKGHLLHFCMILSIRMSLCQCKMEKPLAEMVFLLRYGNMVIKKQQVVFFKLMQNV